MRPGTPPDARSAGRPALLPILSAALAAGLLAACGGGGLKCPEGTVRYGDTCKAADDPGTGDDVLVPEIVQRDDASTPDPVGDPAADPAPDGMPADAPKDTPAEATGPVYPGGFIGKSCQTKANCKNDDLQGSCLGWAGGGYCIVPNCGEGGTPCPEGAVCMGIALEQPACAMACETDADCRVKDGYACKLLPDLSGALQRICHVVDKAAGGPAEGCGDASDCTGIQGCLVNFSGGYCAQLTCGADLPCPDGARCVLLSGKPVCLKGCATADDCKVAGDLPRGCLQLRDPVSGDRVGVCGSASTGGPIGSQCLNDTECLSGRCVVSVTGRCSSTLKGCKVDLDCSAAEVCQQDAERAYGFCTADCSSSKPCTGQAFCVETLGSGAYATTVVGQCMPGCSGDLPCRGEAGMECRYGDPMLVPSRYACVVLGDGDVGMRCTADGDCELGRCLMASDGKAGYCTTPCSRLAGNLCPFPTQCQSLGGESLCLQRCLSDLDCRGGTTCDTNQKPLPVCVP